MLQVACVLSAQTPFLSSTEAETERKTAGERLTQAGLVREGPGGGALVPGLPPLAFLLGASQYAGAKRLCLASRKSSKRIKPPLVVNPSKTDTC